MTTEPLTCSTATNLRSLLLHGQVRSVYQPIVDLDTGRTVAVEALARGPEGPLQSPGALFGAAAAAGLVDELEWACRTAALQGALDGGLCASIALFVNVESAQLGRAVPAALRALEASAQQRLHVVLELTERDLERRPAEVLAATRSARAAGWGVALDDVGAVPASLALMPLIRPDVVKLDMHLVQDRQTVEVAAIASAVASYAEESGALVLAEGIETELHRERALALGATLGQGWLFARPAPLADLDVPAVARPLALLGEPDEDDYASPFNRVGGRLPLRIARKSQLLAMSRHIERQAEIQPNPPILLAAFEHADFFTPATARRYAAFASRCPLVGAFGVDLPGEPAPGVRGTPIDVEDPLADEWTVVVLSPHFAAALLARDLGEPRRTPDRRFEFALTHDRRLVTAAARSLATRIAG
jgi:EAL domain-containing protein (putative c-di-GMP-specific phosphodiesterase class I)